MLINLSNHPYAVWDKRQREAAKVYGECVDMTFPAVNPDAEEQEIDRLADEYLSRIISDRGSDEITVHIMGEQTFCFALICRLLNAGIRCVASCSVRDVIITPEGSKFVNFHFSRFREYGKFNIWFI